MIKKGKINLLHLNLSKLQNESRLIEPEFKPIELDYYGIMEFSRIDRIKLFMNYELNSSDAQAAF